MANAADLLTAIRLPLAAAVGVFIAAERIGVAIVLLMIAWATDLLDGMLARAATSPTRLGNWDFRVDVVLGIALLAGMAVTDRMPVTLTVAAVLIGVGWTQLIGNPAPAMLLMALAYGWFLTILVVEQPSLWWLPFAAIVVLSIVQWRRFLGVIMPAFFNGLSRLARRESGDVPPVLDRWA